MRQKLFSLVISNPDRQSDNVFVASTPVELFYTVTELLQHYSGFEYSLYWIREDANIGKCFRSILSGIFDGDLERLDELIDNSWQYAT